MNRIRLLSEQVANQIAAGEVVERPASVVKELVENALDAKSTRITVEIQAGGRSLIRVSDDGIGMSKDDALMCLERHATSKIQSAQDLQTIATMGFRGEAMPSIASVSRMMVTSRERDSESPEACQIVIHGGKILEVKAAGGSPGTTIEVRSLFYNIPARRKFLRSDPTETSHIQHYLTLAALAYPEVGWTYVLDGRVIWQIPAMDIAESLQSLRARMTELMGNGLQLVPVDYRTEFTAVSTLDGNDETEPPQGFRVWGWIGAPGVSRGTREDQHLFVNRRPVDNRGLNFGLMEGYHTALMKGRYPVCCLFLEIDPSEVDVNIHPSKREVKFRHESWVRRAVGEAVRTALLDFHSESSPAIISPNATPQPDGAFLRKTPESVAVTDPSTARLPITPELRLQGETTIQPLATPPLFPWPDRLSSIQAPSGFESNSAIGVLPPPSPTVVPLLQIPLRILGVISRLYVVLESDRGLVLLDQHAAHERILFEQMLHRLEEGGMPSQRLLLAETVELSPKDANFVRQHLSTLVRMGIGLSEFGERTFLLDGLPPFARVNNARMFVIELIDALKMAGQEVNTWRLGEHMVAKTVCRHAVKANDLLVGPELEKLVDDLRQCQMPYTCPHGRPTLIEMNLRELEKKFGRIQ